MTSPTGESTGDEAAQARLDLIMNSDETHAMFVSQGEIKSALGATIILPRWDTEVEDHMWLDYAAADTAVPSFRHGRLTEVTLWSEWVDGHMYWRHLEHHAVGYIEHALFRGTATNLGQRRPLEDHPSTESYATLVNAESRILTGIDRLTAGASFDLVREMFVGIDIPGKVNDGLQLSAHQFAIRAAEHEQTMRGIMREILRNAGFSPS